MTKEHPEPTAVQAATAAVSPRVPLPPEVQDRVTANLDLLAARAQAATRPAKEALERMRRDNPEIFGPLRSWEEVAKPTSELSYAARQLARINAETEQQVQLTPMPTRPEPALLREVLRQLGETDKHQAAILQIQQAAFERAQQRDADYGDRDRRKPQPPEVEPRP